MHLHPSKINTALYSFVQYVMNNEPTVHHIHIGVIHNLPSEPVLNFAFSRVQITLIRDEGIPPDRVVFAVRDITRNEWVGSTDEKGMLTGEYQLVTRPYMWVEYSETPAPFVDNTRNYVTICAKMQLRVEREDYVRRYFVDL